MVELITFENALEISSSQSKKHLLLGNGFSRACRDDIFSYARLFERAKFDRVSNEARSAFNVLETQDFEIVMRALRQASRLAEIYVADSPELARKLENDAVGLKNLLVETIAANHPARPGDIPLEKYAACKQFLSHFKNVYTLNYDLLLYWATMQTEVAPNVPRDDGFREPDDGPCEYVTWDIEKTDNQSIHYLHGALHVFDAGAEIQKFTWANTGIALVDQIRAALESGRYPLFVSEGTAREKMARIQHSNFLGRTYRSFAKIGGALFVFGMSMAENDEHILELIDRGKTRILAIGLYGDPTSQANAAIVQRMEAVKSKRKGRYPVDIYYFDAASAQVWG